ncbi:hypothetical protein DsansV1_C27g0200391 [Dioscorea sansibarensis]
MGTQSTQARAKKQHKKLLSQPSTSSSFPTLSILKTEINKTMAMLSFPRFHILLLLFLLITPSLILFRVQGENRNGNKDSDGNNKECSGKTRGDQEEQEQDPALVERAIGITGFTSRWDSIWNWVKLAWLNLRPPDSGSMSGSSASDVMKEAATRSFETSKEAMEQAASSAANLAGEAVEKTKEKVKRAVSMPHAADRGQADAEL